MQVLKLVNVQPALSNVEMYEPADEAVNSGVKLLGCVFNQ
jgi:hypothetical protein